MDFGAQDERHVIQARLREEMPSYDHENGAAINFQLIKDQFATAYKRAKLLNESRQNEGVPFGRPSTTVGDLVRKIYENGKGTFAKRQR
jgi:hypothetical protein